MSYDAWGKRRFPNGAEDPINTIESQTTRGYTGHEQLDSVGLIHMNARVYDPLVARMISPDTMVPDPLNPQAWNRYSYVGNDPLTFTDPTGHSWLSEFFHGLSNAIRSLFQQIPFLRSIMQIVLTTVLTLFTPLGPFVAAAFAAGIVTGLSGGKIGEIIRSAAIAGFTAWAFNLVGDLTGHTPDFGTPAYAANIAGHAGVGCLSALASGGRCEPGALSAGLSAAAAPAISVASQGNVVGGVVASSVVGGLGSLAGGGKFEDGAVTGAFGYLFNSAWHSHTAVPFIDDQGNPVLDFFDKQMMRPSDVDPHFFVDAAIFGGGLFGGLFNFRQQADWDVQRVGTDALPTKEFVDFATVVIGLYGAARGIPLGQLLSAQDTYASTHSNFGDVDMDKYYTHLPVTNVWNTKLGYDLFYSGKVGFSPSQ